MTNQILSNSGRKMMDIHPCSFASESVNNGHQTDRPRGRETRGPIPRESIFRGADAYTVGFLSSRVAMTSMRAIRMSDRRCHFEHSLGRVNCCPKVMDEKLTRCTLSTEWCKIIPVKLRVFPPIFPKMADLAGCGSLLLLAEL